MGKKIVKKAGDAAGVGPYARERERLVPLGELRGWNVVDGEVDIRSWEVKTVSGKVLGTVRELLVDPKAGEAVMLDVDVAGTDERALVPLRIVEIDRMKRVVRADSADLEISRDVDDAGRPRYTDEELSQRHEVRYADATGERVVERRPIVEETVVRRREPEERL